MTKFLSEYTDGGPGCMRDDCMITANGPSMTTAMHFPPVYNKQGVNMNPDMNITTKSVRCLSCGKSWSERWQNGIKLD